MDEVFVKLVEGETPTGALLNGIEFSPGWVWVVSIFLLLLGFGILLDLLGVLYCFRRSVRPSDWSEALERRAFSGGWVALLFLIMVALYVAHSLAYSLLFPGSTELEPRMLIFQAGFFHIPMLILLWGTLRIQKRSGIEQFGLFWRKAPVLLGLSVVFYVAIMPMIWFYSMVSQLFLEHLGYQSSLQEVTQIFLVPLPALERGAILLVAIVLAPLFEEVFFRGVLFPWVVRRAGFWPGILSVSLLFAGIHFHLPSFLPLFLLSITFCLSYARTKSLLVPIGMHVIFNGITILFLTLMD